MDICIEGLKTSTGRRGFQPRPTQIWGDVYAGTIYFVPVCMGVTFRSWVVFYVVFGVVALAAVHTTCRMAGMAFRGIRHIME